MNSGALAFYGPAPGLGASGSLGGNLSGRLGAQLGPSHANPVPAEESTNWRNFVAPNR